MKRIIGFLTFIFLNLYVFAEIPINYYSTLEGKKTSELKTAVHLAIKTHVHLSYSALWTYYAQTDCRPENPSQIWDMYSANVTYFSDHSTLDKEHCVPNSWWGGPTVDNEYAYSDLNNLYPANSSINQSKSNNPLSEVGVTTMNNGVSKSGTSITPGYTGKGFEPADEFKGDFARTYFYMATCYQDYTTWRTDATGQYMITLGAYPSILPWGLDLLLKWHRMDPVSVKETTRNDIVYTLQSNRNPFIDYPDLIEYIWGNKTTFAWSNIPTDMHNAHSLSDIKIVNQGHFIQITAPNPTFSYSIFSIEGKKVFASSATQSVESIDVSSFQKGVYLIQVVQDGRVYHQKEFISR
ncbi:MAG: endonuclease [Bacteroidales bacterium]|nr:endonuclease [Bacteroidales bacterium]